MKIYLSILLSLIICCSCSKYGPAITNQESLEFIPITKSEILSDTGLNKGKQIQFNEARHRFKSNIKETEDGFFMEKSPEELCISSDLYDLFYIAYVTLPNTQQKYKNCVTSKAPNGSIEIPVDSNVVDFDFDFALDSLVDYGPTGTRGNTVYIDAIASSIETLAYSLGMTTTAKFWHMWYFDARDTPYTLTEEEWLEVKSHAESSYNNWGRGEHSVTFDFQSDPDLHFTYGTATALFDSQGTCIAFRDTYDMNRMSGGRSKLDELITAILSYIGNTEGGFEILYNTQY